MLVKEKPDLVAIGPRWATEHHAMSMAALQAGAHLYLEKPFTITLAEADDIVRLAKRNSGALLWRMSRGWLRRCCDWSKHCARASSAR